MALSTIPLCHIYCQLAQFYLLYLTFTSVLVNMTSHLVLHKTATNIINLEASPAVRCLSNACIGRWCRPNSHLWVKVTLFLPGSVNIVCSFDQFVRPQKWANIKWIPDMENAFKKMKLLMAMDALAAYPDHNKRYDILTDASD